LRFFESHINELSDGNMARSSANLFTPANVSKAVAKFGVTAHIVVRKPDGTITTFKIRKDTPSAPNDDNVQTGNEWD
jgi:hypothetical protein